MPNPYICKKRVNLGTINKLTPFYRVNLYQGYERCPWTFFLLPGKVKILNNDDNIYCNSSNFNRTWNNIL